jgi:hypothetical protein
MMNGQERSYKQCFYNAQGFLCKSGDAPASYTAKEKYSLVDSNIVIEPFVETTPRGKDVDNKTVDMSFTERATSHTIWDKTSAGIICGQLCSKFNQAWTQGFRSAGGSVCYCQDIPPPSSSSNENTPNKNNEAKRPSETTSVEQHLQMNYL